MDSPRTCMSMPNMRSEWRLIEERDPYPSNLAITLGKNLMTDVRGVHVFTRYEVGKYRYKFELATGIVWAHADAVCPEFADILTVYDETIHYIVMFQDRHGSLVEARLYDRCTHERVCMPVWGTHAPNSVL